MQFGRVSLLNSFIRLWIRLMGVLIDPPINQTNLSFEEIHASNEYASSSQSGPGWIRLMRRGGKRISNES